MSAYDTYTSPLASRNASKQMLALWSPRHKFNLWRKIWLAVAEAQHELTKADGGTPKSTTGGTGETPVPPGARTRELVTREQVEELRAVVERGITDAEMQAAEKYERELRHDVMAHVHALGDACPKAKGIIHLGMTSQDVVCNADLVTIHAARELVRDKLARLIIDLGAVATKHVHTPTLGFTHYQPAQPLTVGRRFAQYACELHITFRNSGGWSRQLTGGLMLRGLRGATGTQAAFSALLGDARHADRLEAKFLSKVHPGASFNAIHQEPEGLLSAAIEQCEASIADITAKELQPKHLRKYEQQREQLLSTDPLAFASEDACRFNSEYTFDLVTQTYPRVIDTFILADLASCAAVLHKIATDIRLLCNRKELDEPFEDKQIGSSAMPYKRNPMRCERICGLTRFVMNLVGNAYDTAATQWLERTLDDSSNRRLSLPEAFLALDGALDLMHNVASGLIVHEAMVRKNLMAELPFMATENILMACVQRGGDRQEYHELIREHAQVAGMRVKHEGLDNDLLERLQSDKRFWSTARGGPLHDELRWDNLLDPMQYVGRSVEQTERFVRDVIEPLRERYADDLAKLEANAPRV